MKKGTYWVGVLSGVVLAALVGFFLLPTLGVFDTTATGKPGILDWWGGVNLDNYVSRKAPDSTIPAEADLAEGFEHYLSMCLHCHGGPDASREEWAHHMLPEPPKLWEEDVQQVTDGTLFYVVANGIRMTGMPAFGPVHSEGDIWNIVAIVRQLNQLSTEQKLQMQKTSSGYDHDAEEDAEHGDEKGHDHNETPSN